MWAFLEWQENMSTQTDVIHIIPMVAFKQEINAIRVELNHLIDENNRLSVQNLELEEQIEM